MTSKDKSGVDMNKVIKKMNRMSLSSEIISVDQLFYDNSIVRVKVTQKLTTYRRSGRNDDIISNEGVGVWSSDDVQNRIMCAYQIALNNAVVMFDDPLTESEMDILETQKQQIQELISKNRELEYQNNEYKTTIDVLELKKKKRWWKR